MKVKQVMRIMTVIVILAISVLLVSGCGGGGSESKPKSLDVVGNWSGNITVTNITPSQTVPATINITSQMDGVISGIIKIASSGNLSFSGTINNDGSILTYTYKGNDGLVVNGTGSATTTAISGTFTDSASESGTFSFTKS